MFGLEKYVLMEIASRCNGKIEIHRAECVKLELIAAATIVYGLRDKKSPKMLIHFHNSNTFWRSNLSRVLENAGA